MYFKDIADKAVRWAGIAAILAMTSFVWAGAYDDGVIAYNKKDYAEALRLFRIASDQGNARAQGNLGYMYGNGRGVPKDDKEAVRWYRLAAEQGNALAQSNLGQIYANGQGVKIDYSEAAKWYRLAAKQGNAVAQFSLGVLLDEGRGVAKNPKEAIRWYQQAASQKYAGAQFNLGMAYKRGSGVSKDYQEAVRWFRRAAELGDTDAQYSLGLAYVNGDGIAKDILQAYMWFSLAAAKGDDEAAKGVSTLTKNLHPAQIASAKKMTNACIAQNYKKCGAEALKRNPLGDLANESVDSLERALANCDTYSAGEQRTVCLRSEANKWLAGNAALYSSIPSGYITGIDLAKSFVR